MPLVLDVVHLVCIVSSRYVFQLFIPEVLNCMLVFYVENVSTVRTLWRREKNGPSA